MSTAPLLPGLHHLTLGQVNAYLIEDPAGPILIDTGFPNKFAGLEKALASVGHKSAEIRHVLLTHTHPDHIGSAAALRSKSGAMTYAHPTDAPLIRAGRGWPKLTPAPGLVNLLFTKLIHPADQTEPCPIDREISDGDTLVGGLSVHHAPGHRAGQVCFLWPQHGGVLFAADAAMNLRNLDVTVAYEDFALGQQTLRKLSALSFEHAVFGHGKPILGGASAQFRQKFT